MTHKLKDRILLIGIGNEFRSDDGVGIHIVRTIAEKHIQGVSTLEQSGEGSSLIEAWKDARAVILVDAVSSNGEPGTAYHFEAHKENIPVSFFNYSTHAFSVAEAVELARALGQLPEIVHIYGIEGLNFSLGSELSLPVKKTMEATIETIMQEITIELIKNHIGV